MNPVQESYMVSRKTFLFSILLLMSLLFLNVGSYSFYKGFNSITGSELNYSNINFTPDTATIKVSQEGFIKAGLLFDLSKNKVVWLKGINSRCDIASLSKMMTIL